MSDVLTDIRFWQQVLTDSERTVICSPENESRCKGYVDARGLARLIHVEASPAVDDDQLFIIDHGALDATIAENEQRDRNRRHRLDAALNVRLAMLAVVPPRPTISITSVS